MSSNGSNVYRVLTGDCRFNPAQPATDLPRDPEKLYAKFPRVSPSQIDELAAGARGDIPYKYHTHVDGGVVRCGARNCRNAALASTSLVWRCPRCRLDELEAAALEADRARQGAAREAHAENERAVQFQHKYDTLAAATTVDDLRAWIQEHVLTN